jgi:hypothetical protein
MVMKSDKQIAMSISDFFYFVVPIENHASTMDGMDYDLYSSVSVDWVDGIISARGDFIDVIGLGTTVVAGSDRLVISRTSYSTRTYQLDHMYYLAVMVSIIVS